MTIVIKIGLLGIIGALLAVQFKAIKPEYGIYIGFAVSILVFVFCIDQMECVLYQFQAIHRYLGDAGGYLGVLLKVIGITYICEFSAGICKDAGFGSVADQIEIMGKLSVIFAGMPILLAVIEQIQGFA